MSPKRIQPGLRYTLAQLALRLLFGRKWHYISPWPKAGTAAIIFPVNKGRVLLAQRAGKVEHVGCWSGIGGFMELPLRETMAMAAVREFYEETGLRLNASAMPRPNGVFMSYGQVKNEEASSDVVSAFFYLNAPDNLIENLIPQEETSAFTWFTAAECHTMMEGGLIPVAFTDTREALLDVFARIEAGETFAPLPL